MPSPFPGMDPYLEADRYWSLFHVRMVVECGNALDATLPERYYADVDTHVWLAEGDDDRVLIGRPDVGVFDADGAGAAAAEPAAVAVLDAPLETTLPVDAPAGPRFVRITDRQSSRLVTAIELLSPSNKWPGPGRAAYLDKRREYLTQGVNLVEIDLLRAGPRPPLGRPVASPYYALVARSATLPAAAVWPITLRGPLPTLPVPLAAGDADAALPLQQAFDRVYALARFRTRIDYAQPPAPPLPDADAAWGRDLLAARPAGGR